MASNTELFKDRSIRYLNKDFAGFKRDLINFSKAHHTGVFQDFNETSPGMALLEHVAYIGDVLSFYQDMAFNEIKNETARQVENVVAFAKDRGYRPQGKRAAQGTELFALEVPATVIAGEFVPDDAYTPVMRMGAKLDGPNGVVFETVDAVDFTVSTITSPRMVTGSRFDASSGVPTHFAVRKSVGIIAGETKTTTFSVNSFQPFLALEIPDVDVIEVLSVIDSDGKSWYEVDFLAQETVFDFSTNIAQDSDVVPYVLKLRAVPRRFITDRNPTTRKTSMVFGSGDGVNFDDELIPNLADLSLPLPGRRTFGSFAIDPQNFLKTMSLGLSPFDTTLTVSYRVGGGDQTNVPARTISSVREATFDFTLTNLDPTKKSAVVGSLVATNAVKTENGAGEETVSEIKANAAAFFAAQNRVVTREDFIARIMSLPAKFGKPEKVLIRRDNVNSSAVDAHILSLDVDEHLTQASPILMKNISTYLSKYRLLTDAINLMRTDIINVGVEFGVVVSPKMNRTEVITKCLNVVRDYLDVGKAAIGSPIILSDLQATIQAVFGVISVYKLNVKNLFGRTVDAEYSATSLDISSWTANGILYCPENAIYEVKFPNRDIVGESK